MNNPENQSSMERRTPDNLTWPLVHAIILGFNHRDDIIRCLGSVRQMTYPNLEVVVVDNASSDDTAAAVRSRFPEYRLLVNGRNLGFGAGVNVGIKAALAEGADFVFILNPDTVVSPDLVTVLVESMLARPRAGIIGPKTYFLEPMPDGRARLLYAGAWRRLLPLRQRIPGIEQPDSGNLDQPVRVDYVWGHGMMIRSAALRQVGLFDTIFFMYNEDLDLCRRMAAHRFEIWYEPGAVLWHDIVDGARAGRSEAWRWRYKVRSMCLFHRKYYGRRAAPLFDALTFLHQLPPLLRNGQFLAIRHLAAAFVSVALLQRRWR